MRKLTILLIFILNFGVRLSWEDRTVSIEVGTRCWAVDEEGDGDWMNFDNIMDNADYWGNFDGLDFWYYFDEGGKGHFLVDTDRDGNPDGPYNPNTPEIGEGGDGSSTPPYEPNWTELSAPPEDEEDDPIDLDEDGGQKDDIEDEDYEDYERGIEGVDKIKEDLLSNKIEVKAVRTLTTGEAIVTSLGLGASYLSIITSALEFLDKAGADQISAFGKTLGFVGLSLNTAQTIMVLVDGEFTPNDIINTVAWAAGGIALLGSFPIAASAIGITGGIVAGAGIVSGVLGVASTFFNYEFPTLYILECGNGNSKLYILIS